MRTYEHNDNGPGGKPLDTNVIKNIALGEPHWWREVKFSASDATITSNHIHIKDAIPVSTAYYTVDMDVDTTRNIITDYSYYRSFSDGANAVEEECSLHIKNISLANNKIGFIDTDFSSHGIAITYHNHEGHSNHYGESNFLIIDSLRIFGQTLIAHFPQKVNLVNKVKNNFGVTFSGAEIKIIPSNDLKEISIFDLIGNRKYECASPDQNFIIRTDGWPCGMYIVVMRTKNGVYSNKVMVSK